MLIGIAMILRTAQFSFPFSRRSCGSVSQWYCEQHLLFVFFCYISCGSVSQWYCEQQISLAHATNFAVDRYRNDTANSMYLCLILGHLLWIGIAMILRTAPRGFWYQRFCCGSVSQWYCEQRLTWNFRQQLAVDRYRNDTANSFVHFLFLLLLAVDRYRNDTANSISVIFSGFVLLWIGIAMILRTAKTYVDLSRDKLWIGIAMILRTA